MYIEQRDRLTAKLSLGLSTETANAIVARAYGYDTFDAGADTLLSPIAGLQKVKSPADIRALDDSVLQMMEFVRMAQNLVAPKLRPLLGQTPQGVIVATMWGFPNFEALKAYARRDKIDPTSTEPSEIARFKRRTNTMPPSQYLLGRDYSGSTLIIHNKADETSQWINQEICLNNLEDLQVGLIRCDVEGDDYLNRYSRDHVVVRQALSENHSSFILGARAQNPKSRLSVSILPKRTYTLEELVAAHHSALGENAIRGSSLIVDRVPFLLDEPSLDAGFRLAKSISLNLVLVTDAPAQDLWSRCETRLIFSYDRTLPLSGNSEMNSALIFASPFTGLKRQNLQLVYHTSASGPVYSTVQLVPDDKPKGASVLSRIFGRPALG